MQCEQRAKDRFKLWKVDVILRKATRSSGHIVPQSHAQFYSIPSREVRRAATEGRLYEGVELGI